MTRTVRLAIVIIVLHALLAILHGVLHTRIPVALSSLQLVFVAAVVLLAPLAAAVLLWRQEYRIGGSVLLVAMGASFVFGVYHHFVHDGPDHIAHIARTTAGMLFIVTAVLLAITEAIGTWIGEEIKRKASRA